MAYSGRYQPINPTKYRGNPSNIIYRSLWEREVMIEFDMNESILEWASEEMFVPYKSPLDNKWHRYFPDFIIKMKERDGSIKTKMIEIKPLGQTKPPPRHDSSKKPTKKYLQEVATYGLNMSKWNAAKAYCDDRNWEFVVLTEKELGI